MNGVFFRRRRPECPRSGDVHVRGDELRRLGYRFADLPQPFEMECDRVAQLTLDVVVTGRRAV
jgi:hypothetical protein